METFDAIESRRSIRKFSSKEIPVEVIKKILDAGIKAPSAKNRQPWKFLVVTDKEKPLMAQAMRKGLENEKRGAGMFNGVSEFLSGAEYSLKIMEQAPVTVFVFNTAGNGLWSGTDAQGKLADVANIQSIGAAIENMLLAATDLGLGSLWICDVFFAYREICDWLGEKNELVAAVSFGYAEENPNPRPRKDLGAVVEWR